MNALQESLLSDLTQIKEKSPVILNLTNYVAMSFNANALLALGASPIMSESPKELKELLTISGALVVNMGTLNEKFCERAEKAAEMANTLGKPIVFDPVGAGATSLRTQFANDFVSHFKPSSVRGNASEVLAVFGKRGMTKGVDTALSSDAAFEVLKDMVLPCSLTISGERDYVLSPTKKASSQHGSSLMTRVTAMGCTATAITGAFLAVNPDIFSASLNAMIVMGIAGEKAAHKADGPGTFQSCFLDALYRLSFTDFSQLKVEFL